MAQVNDFPDIVLEFDDSQNPTIQSPNCAFGISFYETPDTLADVDEYKRFLENAISRFRNSVLYKHYKDYIMNDVGIDHCQVLGNLDGEMVTLEMHHNFLTIYDIALMISESVLKRQGRISTFDLVQLLKEEHKNNNIPIVILSKTVHQEYHNTHEMYLPPKMCFGYWMDLILKYKDGLTIDIANKIISYLNYCLDYAGITNKTLSNILELRDQLEDWSVYNDCGSNLHINTIAVGSNYYSEQYCNAIYGN